MLVLTVRTWLLSGALALLSMSACAPTAQPAAPAPAPAANATAPAAAPVEKAAAAAPAPAVNTTPPPAAPAAAPAASAAPPSEQEGNWPRSVLTDGATFTVYQPQLTSWDGYKFRAMAAVMVQEAGQETQTFGSIQIDATSLVDKDERTVLLENVTVSNAKFPSAPGKASRYQKALNGVAQKADTALRSLELDQLESSLDISSAQKAAARNVKNDPPQIIFATSPTLLIYVDGSPVWRAVEKTALERVVNTRPLLVRDKTGTVFLKVFDGWMQAPSLEGNWSVTLQAPPELEVVLKQALEAKAIDPLSGTSPEQKDPAPTLKVNPPRILVATRPTELIVTQGAPEYTPIPSTNLLFVSNTTGNVFKHTGTQQTYVLISGRWFKAPTEKGPWEFAPAEKLPKDFAAIPDDSPKENAKAAVPGTAQAQEAVIANSIPQTAKVDRQKATFKPQIDGEPKFELIETTTIYRLINSPTPILRVATDQFYAVENGVWFKASKLEGPWTVADLIPAVIYTIPASSPVYYVTYVRVYDVTPTTVVVGYTPGYYGTYVSNGVVVYGTGYYYTPWVGSVWYGPPVTYGFGVGIAYTPWTGWCFGFGFGWSWGHATMGFGGWGWGPYPWWGPVGVGFYGPGYYPWAYGPHGGAVWGPRPGSGAVWGPGGWAASTGNVYSRWGATTAVTRQSGGYNAWTGNSWSQDVGRSYNSRTGTLSAGQRSSVGNVYTGNYQTSASGARVNTKTGGAALGGSVTRGNAYTGNEVTAGRAAVKNPVTGDITTAGGVRGENGSVARVGDDVYVNRDGNVSKRDANGWQSQTRDGSWDRVPSNSSSASDLNRASQQRDAGQRRYNGYSQGAHRSAGYGGRGGGGGGRGRR